MTTDRDTNDDELPGKSLQELLEGLVGQHHEVIRALCKSWDLTPGRAIQLMLECAITMAIDSKKDDASEQQVFEMLTRLFAKKIALAQSASVILEKLRVQFAASAEAAYKKKEGHA